MPSSHDLRVFAVSVAVLCGGQSQGAGLLSGEVMIARLWGAGASNPFFHPARFLLWGSASKCFFVIPSKWCSRTKSDMASGKKWDPVIH